MSGKTSAFRELHLNIIPLRLPNAWDAGSARLIESLGAPAVATTSSGVAWALGYRDGRSMPVEDAVAVASRILRVVKIPVSIDIENGYSDDPKSVAELVKRLASIGVAGINIEDGADHPKLLVAKIEAIRTALSAAGVDIFVNARTDVFLAALVEPKKQVEETLKRAESYISAGADGVFVPGLHEAKDVKIVAGSFSVPLNLMAWGGLGDAAALGKLGVRRLSTGSAVSQMAWNTAEVAAKQFLETGDSEPLTFDSKPFGEMQNLFPSA